MSNCTIRINSKKYGTQYVLIDEVDKAIVEKYKWFVAVNKTNRKMYVKGYLRGRHEDGYIYLHRLLLTPEPNMQVDHINGDPLDNRHSNLRICTCQQNTCNQSKRCDNTSGYKGVTWNKKNKKWHSQIWANGTNIHLGYFENKHQAALMYDMHANDLHGEFAMLNFEHIPIQAAA